MYKHVVDTTQSRVKKRNETSVIGREERKKQDGIWYFHKLLRSVFLKEFGSSPSTPNKQ